MKNSTTRSWPNGCMFQNVECGEPFTMKMMNEIWIKTNLLKNQDNAACLHDGRTFKFKKDSIVYPKKCCVSDDV